MGKLKIELKSPEHISKLLQEAYILADEQLTAVDREITKLTVATNLEDESADGKAKYAKAINDFLSIKDKAIRTKLDIAKVMTEVYNHSGDNGDGGGSNNTGNLGFDLQQIKKMVDQTNTGQKKVIEITK